MLCLLCSSSFARPALRVCSLPCALQLALAFLPSRPPRWLRYVVVLSPPAAVAVVAPFGVAPLEGSGGGGGYGGGRGRLAWLRSRHHVVAVAAVVFWVVRRPPTFMASGWLEVSRGAGVSGCAGWRGFVALGCVQPPVARVLSGAGAPLVPLGPVACPPRRLAYVLVSQRLFHWVAGRLRSSCVPLQAGLSVRPPYPLLLVGEAAPWVWPRPARSLAVIGWVRRRRCPLQQQLVVDISWPELWLLRGGFGLVLPRAWLRVPGASSLLSWLSCIPLVLRSGSGGSLGLWFPLGGLACGCGSVGKPGPPLPSWGVVVGARGRGPGRSLGQC